MPVVQNFSGDTMMEIIKDLYQKTGETPPQMLMDTLTRQVEEERRRDEILKSWVSLNGNVNSNFLGLPFVPISSTVLEEDKSGIVIEIPGQYNHLLFWGQVRQNGTGADFNNMNIRFNEDTGANYGWGGMYHNDTTVAGHFDYSDTELGIVASAADTASANVASPFVVFVPHYNSPYYKTVISLHGTLLSAFTLTAAENGIWKNVSPVKSVTFIADTALYANAKLGSGSIISVYGIM